MPGSRGNRGFDPTVAHPARVYDSVCPPEPTLALGGKDNFEPDRIAGEQRLNQHLGEGNLVGRPREVVARFFDGLDLADPGVVKVTRWRLASRVEAEGPTSLWGGVARKP
jgi:hypothetical protein